MLQDMLLQGVHTASAGFRTGWKVLRRLHEVLKETTGGEFMAYGASIRYIDLL